MENKSFVQHYLQDHLKRSLAYDYYNLQAELEQNILVHIRICTIRQLVHGILPLYRDDHFSAQLQFLEEKTKSLLDATDALKTIISDCHLQKSISWEVIIKLIEYIGLRNAIWEKGFKGGHAADEHGLTAESVVWLDKAIDAYYKERIYNVLNQIKNHSSDDVLKAWEDLLSDMCGDDQHLKSDLIKMAMADDKISQTAKEWLKKVSE